MLVEFRRDYRPGAPFPYRHGLPDGSFVKSRMPNTVMLEIINRTPGAHREGQEIVCGDDRFPEDYFNIMEFDMPPKPARRAKPREE